MCLHAYHSSPVIFIRTEKCLMNWCLSQRTALATCDEFIKIIMNAMSEYRKQTIQTIAYVSFCL